MPILTIDNVSYAINLNKLMNLVSSSDDDAKPVQSSMTEIWAQSEDSEEGLSLISRESTDIKNDNQPSSDRYEIIRSIFDKLINADYNPDGTIKTIDNLTIGEKLCFNTLLINDIIYKINEDK